MRKHKLPSLHSRAIQSMLDIPVKTYPIRRGNTRPAVCNLKKYLPRAETLSRAVQEHEWMRYIFLNEPGILKQRLQEVTWLPPYAMCAALQISMILNRRSCIKVLSEAQDGIGFQSVFLEALLVPIALGRVDMLVFIENLEVFERRRIEIKYGTHKYYKAAASNNQVSMLRFLFQRLSEKRWINPALAWYWRYKALESAVRYGHLETVKYLLPYIKPSSKDRHEMSIAYDAQTPGYNDISKLMDEKFAYKLSKRRRLYSD